MVTWKVPQAARGCEPNVAPATITLVFVLTLRSSFTCTGHKAHKAGRRLPCKCRCLDLWEAAGLFREHLGPDSAQPIPQAALLYLCMMRTRITEELALLPGSSLYPCLVDGGGGSRSAGQHADQP